MALVGIPLETLISLIAGAFATPIIFFVLFWVLWVPKPAKTYCGAKLHKEDVNFEANDGGGLRPWRGKIKGPGVFTGGKKGKVEEVSFIPRSAEDWTNKRFSCDRIGTWFSYSGLAVTASPKNVAVLQANQMLNSDKIKHKKSEVDLSVLPDNVRKSLEKTYLNVEETKGEGDSKLTETLRKQVLLLDPRTLINATSKMLTPDVTLYVQHEAYRQGFNDGEQPLLKRALPLLFVLALIMLAIGMALSGSMTGSGGQAKSVITENAKRLFSRISGPLEKLESLLS